MSVFHITLTKTFTELSLLFLIQSRKIITIRNLLTSGDDVSGSTVTVAELRGDHQLPPLGHAHVEESLVPSLDHLTDAQLECEGCVSVQAVTNKMIFIN